jgi:predicted nucleic acid-binding protein
MKFADILRGYIPPDADTIKRIWAEAHFCFDTNVLLDSYRYSDKNRAAFLKLLGALKGRLFVPNRVAIEFARNRVTVIREHFRPQQVIKSKLEELRKEIVTKYPRHPYLEELVELVESARKQVDTRYGEAEKSHMSLITDDRILKELLLLIGDVGEPFPQLDAEKEFRRRKDGAIPPFCKMDDDKDEERRSGDVVIWIELMKQYEGTKRPLIFVTDDMKENWWRESAGRHDPQPALVQEAHARTGSEVLFYTSERFSESAPGRLGVDVPKGLAEETKQIRAQESLLAKLREMQLQRSRESARRVSIRKDGSIRLYILARELGVGAKELLDLCRHAGFQVQNQLSLLNRDEADAVLALVRGPETDEVASVPSEKTVS